MREIALIRGYEVGLDIIGIARIERAISRWGDRFLSRVFTPRELEDCRGNAASLAARFAAKEAVLKALRVGLARGIRWTDIEVVRNVEGAPSVSLHGAAKELAQERGLQMWRVSLTHSDDMAAAIVVALTAEEAA